MLRRGVARWHSVRQNELVRGGFFYLILSGALMWPNLIHLRTKTVFPFGDGVQMIWANGWVLHAMTHFANPFFSPYLMAPHGTNLLASPCAVGLAILGAPVTWLLGPVATFNVQLLFMPVVSGLAMIFALRGVVADARARWVGGLLWGFSPYVLSSFNTGWTNLGYVFFPPLLAAIVLDEFHFHRRSSVRNGLALGFLLALQITIGSELAASSLLLVALCGGPVLVLAVVRSPDFRRRTAGQIKPLLVGLSGPTLFVTLPLALFALYGPAHLRNWVWDPWVIQVNGLHSLGDVIHGPLEATNPFLPPMAASPHYLGWFGVVVILLGVVVARRSLFARGALLLGLVGLWLSFSDFAAINLWHVLWDLPVVHNIVPSRFFLWVWFGAAVTLAIASDTFFTAHARRRLRVSAVSLVVLALFLSFVVSFRDVLPVDHTNVTESDGLRDVVTQHPGSTIVTFPFPEAGPAMVEQARHGFTFSTPGIFGPAAMNLPQDELAVVSYFLQLVRSGGLQELKVSSAQRESFRRMFAKWGVDYVVVPIRLTEPIAGFPDILHFQMRMVSLFGMPRIIADSFVWDLANFTPPARQPSALDDLYCMQQWQIHPERLPACLMRP